MSILGKTLLILPLAALLGTPARADADPAHLQELALKIDRQVAAFYRSKSLPVPDVTDDATFLRRVFLVAIGRIPTAEEAIFFLETDEPEKRAKLVEYLMKSPGYSSHMSNWVFDLLRITDRPANGRASLDPYRDWVRNAMTDNMPWD